MADDVVDEVQGVSMLTLTSAARVTETLLRSSQDRALHQAQEQREASDEARERYEAQARVAEQTYRRAAEPDFAREQTQDVVVKAWHGAQNWKDLEPERFGAYADRINDNIRTEYGVDLADTADRLGDRTMAADLGEMKIQQARGVDEDEPKLDVDQAADLEADPGVTTGMEWDSQTARDARDAQLDHPDVPDDIRAAARVVDHQRGTDPALAASAGTGPEDAKARNVSRGRGRGRVRNLGR
ncbi:hypothetical protein [Solicola sp. PLA-1-18]|uniref:hypothetical protein n=1 Tax=Solicola sp. PLA-1-18 TaxID=3380532 RepID=UPI003B7D8C49